MTASYRTRQQRINHPCIIGWSMGNGLQQHNAYVRSMLNFTRSELDAHRLLTHVSNTGAWNSPNNDPWTASLTARPVGVAPKISLMTPTGYVIADATENPSPSTQLSQGARAGNEAAK